MTVLYNYETAFHLTDENKYTDWIARMASSENFQINALSFIFCDDNYLLALNEKFLNHNTLTDVITFNYTDDSGISGDVFISIDRVYDNAKQYKVDKNEEVLRVMAHGFLHLIGYNDKTEQDVSTMRKKEDIMIKMFHVEQ